METIKAFYQKHKAVIWFVPKSLILIVLWKPVLTVVAALVLSGLAYLLIAGPFKKYENPIRDVSVLKKGDIVLTGHTSVFASLPIQVSNALTRKLRHRFWTHAAVYKGDGKLIEAVPKGGIVVSDISDVLQRGGLVRAFRHKYLKDEAVIDELLRKCEEKRGSSYGFLGLLFFVISSFVPVSFNFVFDNVIIDKWLRFENKYFCSELIVDSFDDIGHSISPFDGWRVKPTDFISNPLLEPVNP
ncbi:MAG: hypothetical protein HQL11_04090 [Candidatus Omnitrophica bacterium]|nr:hypothetical protein [Candidatus Omnitrophota bacterium]